MNNSDSSSVGRLKVNIDSSSWFFGQNTLVEVRDSEMKLVKPAEGSRSMELPSGLYQVSAVLEDGREHKRFVQIRGGEESEVTIGVPKERVLIERSVRTHERDQPFYRPRNFTQRIETIDETADETAPTEPVQLLEVAGASLMRKTSTLWVFIAEDPLKAVPTARILIGSRETIISLPTSPQGSQTANTCAVRIEDFPTGARATAWISAERKVANAVQNMLASGELRNAVHMAQEAAQLLRDKYSDPTGAAIGALILHKAGRLARLESWVENLARDFAWMPDGKILLATLKVNRRAELDRALQLAVDAAKQRPLYTESYSILLDLLRRWPEGADRKILAPTISDLASESPFTDWDSMCLSRFSAS